MNGVRTCASWLALATAIAVPGTLHAIDYRVPSGTTDPTPKTLTDVDTLTVDQGATLTSPTDPTINQAGVANNVVVTNNGRIEGPAGRAFNTTGNAQPRNITINNGAGAVIVAADDALRISSNIGTGVVTVNNLGTIVGVNGQGIDFDPIANTGGTVTINNFAGGVIQSTADDAVRPGTGTLNNAGTIFSDGAAGSASDAVDTQARVATIFNFNGGVISGFRNGISANGTVSVGNASGGTIAGRNGNGINAGGLATITNLGGIVGAINGVAVGSFNIQNAAGAAILGNTGGGLVASGGGTLLNAGQIAGAIDGVAAGGTINVENQAGGTIVGNGGNGVATNGNLALINGGGIGGTAGGVLSGGSATVTNAAGAQIIGNAGDGVGAENNLTLTNGGNIRGGVNGVVGGGTANVNNAAGATIIGGGANGVAANGNVIVVNAGGIGGATNGVVSGGSANVNNAAAATIVGNSANGVAANGNITLINGGQIGGAANGVIGGGSGNITNAAGTTIVGNSGAGVQVDLGLTLNNAGRIAGGTLGAGAGGNANVTNAAGASIAGGGAGLISNANIVIGNDGAVSGSLIGISAGGNINLTNTAAASVTASNGVGVVAIGNGTIVNAGTISGGAASTTGTVNGDGVRIGGSATITNSGTIQATGSTGGNVSDAINITGGTINNNAAGALISGANNGIVVDDGAGGAGARVTTITNAGTIRGAAGAGIRLTGAFNDVVNNSGTIIGIGGPAVSLGAGDDRLSLVTSSVIQGAIDGGDGTDAILVGGPAGTTGALGPTINFETLNIQAATWVLTGNSTYSGGITVTNGGRLDNRGILLGATSVTSGEVFNGGTYGALSLTGANSAIRPGEGNAIGTITVVGDYSQNRATYFADITAAGAADRIVVGGAATLQGGAVLAITRAPGAYNPGTRYLLLTANGGLTGTFGSVVTDPDPFLFLRVNYSLNAVIVDVLRNPAGINAAAATPNQVAVANAFAGVDVNNPLFTAVGSIVSTPQLTAVLDALSGEAYASTRAGLAQDARRVSAAIATRFENAAPRSGGWLQGIAASGRADGARGAANMKQQAYGAVGGVDIFTVDRMRGGIAFGYTQGKTEVDARGSRTDSDAFQAALYGGGAFGRLNFRLVAGYAWVKLKTVRNVALPTPETVRASYNGSIQFGLGELSYAIPFGNFTLSPFLAGQASHVRTDTISEAGGISALTIASGGEDISAATVGVRAVGPAAGPIMLRGSLGFRRIIGTNRPRIDAVFTGTNGAFNVFGASLPRYAGVGDIDLLYRIGDRARIGIGYSGVVGSGGSDHATRVTLAVGL